ncbi:putative metal-dependent hydrolase YfiT [compost metagenome]
MSEQNAVVTDEMRFPLGPFQWEGEWNEELKAAWIQGVKELPSRLREAVEGLTEEQLDTPYRPEGWTVRQVVHHLADSHMNSFIRFKLALTEAEPSIKPYREELWTELADASSAPVGLSLKLLEALHERWGLLLDSMKEEDFNRTFYHPENKETVPLKKALPLYEWHGRHHTAHITVLRGRMNW